MNEKRLTWKEALRRVMLRYSKLAIQRIHACLHGDGDEFVAGQTARECWHYGLLFRDGEIQRSGRKPYTGEVEYLTKKGGEHD